MSEMSITACLISRYTIPMKFSGMNSCTSMALTSTKSPIVAFPAMMSRTAKIITVVMPRVKIAA